MAFFFDKCEPGFIVSNGQSCHALDIWAFYAAAGVAHLALPKELLAITPSWAPFAAQTILVAGAFERTASVALLTVPLRRSAGVLMAIYAIVVWPANFKHAIYGIDIPYISSSRWYHAPRLAFQPVIVWWALFCSGVIDWPSSGNGLSSDDR